MPVEGMTLLRMEDNSASVETFGSVETSGTEFVTPNSSVVVAVPAKGAETAGTSGDGAGKESGSPSSSIHSGTGTATAGATGGNPPAAQPTAGTSKASSSTKPVLQVLKTTKRIVADGRVVECFNDEHFRLLRERINLTDDFLSDQFLFDDEYFRPGGGKGGELMAFTKDRRFIVKQLSPGDHVTLLEVSSHYVTHVLSGKTLLALMPLHFAYEGSHYLAMLNCLAKEGAEDGYDYLYDLKGCADDKMMLDHGKKVDAVHKRIWHCWMWCGSCFWTQARRAYYTKKRAAYTWCLQTPKHVRENVIEAIRRDCEQFLIPQGLMDYSLIVGSRTIDAPPQQDLARIEQKPPTLPENHASPLLFPSAGCSDKCEFLAIGIIDFLQRWTPIKRVAMCIKVMERDKATIPPPAYGRRFVERFSKKFVAA